MKGGTGSGNQRPANGAPTAFSVRAPAAGRRLLLWRWLLLVGAVLVLGSGFRLAEPAFDAVRGGSGADTTAGIADVPLPPTPVPTTGRFGLPPAVPEQPVVVVNNPSRLRIPRIRVDAPIIHLGLNPDGTLGVPKAWGDVGWYDRGPAPGGIGPAVLVGHYDSTTGPAVFYRLHELVPGDRVEVASPTGVSTTFVVDRAENVVKSRFPANRVYGPVLRPELRLITCGGAFDRKAGHYLNNLVVYAHAESSAGAALVVPARSAASMLPPNPPRVPVPAHSSPGLPSPGLPRPAQISSGQPARPQPAQVGSVPGVNPQPAP
ncbi:class F sortase [Frankia sp. CcWB2]